MPQYITIHRAPGLREEEVAENALEVYNGAHATFLQSYVNLGAGFLVSVYEAENQDQLEEQFELFGFPALPTRTGASRPRPRALRMGRDREGAPS